MKLQLATPNNDEDRTYTIKTLVEADDLDMLLEEGREHARSIDILPVWADGIIIEGIFSGKATHKMELIDDSYLYVEI